MLCPVHKHLSFYIPIKLMLQISSACICLSVSHATNLVCVYLLSVSRATNLVCVYLLSVSHDTNEHPKNSSSCFCYTCLTLLPHIPCFCYPYMMQNLVFSVLLHVFHVKTRHLQVCYTCLILNICIFNENIGLLIVLCYNYLHTTKSMT